MQQRRKWKWRSLGTLRKLLTCAICSLSLMALFSAHSRIHVFPPSQLQKLPPDLKLSALDGASGSLDSNKLWKPPANRSFVSCVEPSSAYTVPGNTRGYLLVNTNGGLNQMRAGNLNADKNIPFGQ